jgi:magnesium transporter
MLSALPNVPDDSKALSNAVWIDFVDPIPTETAAFEKAFGLRVPSRDELSEIETTSRLHVEHDALYMTAPLIVASGDEPWIPAPTGFVLSKTVLLTVRFTKSTVFDAVSKELNAKRFEPTLAYARILEELVDHMADLLEATIIARNHVVTSAFVADGPNQRAYGPHQLRLGMPRSYGEVHN